MKNLLTSFDNFQGKELITERDLQDYLGRYQDLRDKWRRRHEAGERADIIDDIVFEVELIKLIETFIAGINDAEDVMTEWHNYVVEQRERDLETIITEEQLKPEDTRKYLENAFRDAEIKTAGIDIDRIMPPVSRFGGGGRAKKKQSVIDKLKNFFEKYFGIGGSSSFAEAEDEQLVYDTDVQRTLPMVAENSYTYGVDN